MEFLWLLMPIGCIVMMTIGRRSNESDRGCFHHQPITSEDLEQTSDDLERFNQALQRRASAAALSPEDTERLRRILNATADQGRVVTEHRWRTKTTGAADERVE